MSRSARLSGRLETWKEIGSFLGCDGRTAKRWEVSRGLPVHRIPGAGRSKVFAYADELTVWLSGVGPEPDISGSGAVESDPTSSSPQSRHNRAPFAALSRAWPSLAAGALVVVVVSTSFAMLADRRASSGARAQPNAEAVQFYQAGLNSWNTRTPDGLHMAVDDFTQAIVRDPEYAEAYAGLANCYNLLREYTDMAPSEAYPRAKAAALRAIALDDKLAGGHLAYAFEQFFWEWNTPVAAREFRRAIELDPNSAMAHHWYASFDLHLGRPQEALAEITRAQQLDPLSIPLQADKGRILYSVGRKQDALDLLKRLERTTPGNLSPHNYLADMYLARGDGVDYIAELRKSADLMQDSTRSEIATAAERGLSEGGEHAMLAEVLKVQLGLRARGLASNYDVARSYAWLGDLDNALTALTASHAAHESAFIGVKIDCAFSPLHDSPRFAAFVRTFSI